MNFQLILFYYDEKVHPSIHSLIHLLKALLFRLFPGLSIMLGTERLSNRYKTWAVMDLMTFYPKYGGKSPEIFVFNVRAKFRLCEKQLVHWEFKGSWRCLYTPHRELCGGG